MSEARRLLWAMVAKELRTLLRERGQIVGLVLSMVFGLGWPLAMAGMAVREYISHRESEAARAEGATETEASGATAPVDPLGAEMDQLMGDMGDSEAIRRAGDLTLRWAVVGGVAFLAFMSGTAFGSAMALAAFAGEKEGGTLELVLVAPLSDRKLYLLKCLSVTLLPVAIAYAMLAVIGAAVLWGGVVMLPEWVLGRLAAAGLWSLPVPLLVVGLFTSMEVYCSVKADSTKGAGQLFGMILVGLMIVCVALPWLLAVVLPEGMRSVLWGGVRQWLGRPFAAQYATVAALVLLVTFLFVHRGYRLFDRERMLT